MLKCELTENIDRIKKRGRSYNEAKDISYLKSLEQKYHLFQNYVKKEIPKCKVLEIDTTCMTPVEVLHQLENYIFSEFVSINLTKKHESNDLGIKC